MSRTKYVINNAMAVWPTSKATPDSLVNILDELFTDLDAKQAADADLTSIAALTTTAFGRGLLESASGQIAFPATQNPSADANTLDDYEEGTWTPVVTFVTPGDQNIAYSTQYGTYTKVGRLVTVTFVIALSTFTHTTASGNLRVTGLPFAAKTATGYSARGALQIRGYTNATLTSIIARVDNATSHVDFIGSGSGVTNTTLSSGDMPTGGSVALMSTITYETA